MDLPQFTKQTFVPNIEGVNRALNRELAGHFVVKEGSKHYVAHLIWQTEDENTYLLGQASHGDRKQLAYGRLSFEHFFNLCADTYLVTITNAGDGFCRQAMATAEDLGTEVFECMPPAQDFVSTQSVYENASKAFADVNVYLEDR